MIFRVPTYYYVVRRRAVTASFWPEFECANPSSWPNLGRLAGARRAAVAAAVGAQPPCTAPALTFTVWSSSETLRKRTTGGTWRWGETVTRKGRTAGHRRATTGLRTRGGRPANPTTPYRRGCRRSSRRLRRSRPSRPASALPHRPSALPVFGPPAPAAPPQPVGPPPASGHVAAVALLNLTGLGLGYALIRDWVRLAVALAATGLFLLLVLPADTDGAPGLLVALYALVLIGAALDGARRACPGPATAVGAACPAARSGRRPGPRPARHTGRRGGRLRSGT